MSKFGNYIAEFIDQANESGQGEEITAASLAARMGIKQSMMSRFIHGNATRCNPRTLKKMCEGISPEASVQAGLLAAYLEDQKIGPAKEMVHIEIRNGSHPSKDEKDWMEDLPKQVLADMKQIAQKINNAALRRNLHNLAELARDHL